MSRKIIGVTVGTPLSASKIRNDFKPEIKTYVDDLQHDLTDGRIVVHMATNATNAISAQSDAKGNNIDATYATKAEVAAQMGDISTALDRIIAIQNSLIPRITFTVDYPIINGYGIELHAKAGMTWEAWVHSEYNVEVNTFIMADKLLYQDGEYLHGTWGDEVVYNSKGEEQTLSDVIVAGETYTIETR